MELRHIRYFVAVAEELNFRRAAERLYMAQPPLSQQIRQLEAEIGTTLFDRSARRVSLTEAGRAFLLDARAILERADSAIARARRIGRGDEGRLRVGFASSAAYDLLPRMVRRFRERYPDVELELTELLGPEQTQALHERRIDVGLAVQPEPSDEVVLDKVAQLRLIVALPEAHRLTARTKVELKDLDGEPFMRFPRTAGSGFVRFVDRLFQDAGVTPRPAQATEELQTALGLVAAGLGFTLVPESVRSLTREGLVFRELTEPAAKVWLGIASRQDERSPLVPHFLAVAHEAAAELGEAS